jgi:hypothetical protein
MSETKTIDPRTVVPLQDVMPAEWVWIYRAVPVELEGKTLTVLMDDPTEMDAIDSLHHLLRCEDVKPLQVTTEELNAIMRRFYGAGEIDGMRKRRDALIMREQMTSPDSD